MPAIRLARTTNWRYLAISIDLTCYSPSKGACWTIAGKSNNRHRWLRA